MTTIQVRTKFEGVHCYPDAPEEVAYLRQPHRHIFGVCVEVEAFHEDRELEFIMVKHLINGYIDNFSVQNGCVHLGTLSCEQIAKSVFNHLQTEVKEPDKRYWKITVDEDGENGASVEFHGAEQLPQYMGVVRPVQQTNSSTVMWTLNEYQHRAYQNIQDHYNQKEEVMHWAIGLGEEAGETLSVIKHRYYAGCYDSDDDMLDDLVNELGDVLWHISALCTVIGIDLEDVAKYNIAKLSNRYPNGKFEKTGRRTGTI